MEKERIEADQIDLKRIEAAEQERLKKIAEIERQKKENLENTK